MKKKLEALINSPLEGIGLQGLTVRGVKDKNEIVHLAESRCYKIAYPTKGGTYSLEKNFHALCESCLEFAGYEGVRKGFKETYFTLSKVIQSHQMLVETVEDFLDVEPGQDYDILIGNHEFPGSAHTLIRDLQKLYRTEKDYEREAIESLGWSKGWSKQRTILIEKARKYYQEHQTRVNYYLVKSVYKIDINRVVKEEAPELFEEIEKRTKNKIQEELLDDRTWVVELKNDVHLSSGITYLFSKDNTLLLPRSAYLYLKHQGIFEESEAAEVPSELIECKEFWEIFNNLEKPPGESVEWKVKAAANLI